MKNILKGILLTLAFGLSFSSCSDFFETESTHTINSDKDHLNVSSDTIYSMVGILNRLQAIGDRTILLGEARGDLMDVTDYTSGDLRDVAMFNVGDDNMYNSPRDYYAIINNCNYFIAKADTALKNNRNQYLFREEYAAAKAIRAWTYLQLVINYGKVPFVIDPILTKEEAEKDYPMYGIQEICSYFINEDGLYELANQKYPYYGIIKDVPSSLFFIPMYVLLGDLNLWAGNYAQSAWDYYRFLSTRNGSESAYPTGTDAVYWMLNTWTSVNISSRIGALNSESFGPDTECVFIIPGDSVPSEGYYSQLRNIMNSSEDNNYNYSLTPSQAICDLSDAQVYCHYAGNGNVIYAPTGLKDQHLTGDLRLYSSWSQTDNGVDYNGNRISMQYISKYSTRNLHLYRRQMVYLRLAEALNRAGFPYIAYLILTRGLDNTVINAYAEAIYPESAAYLGMFDFPNSDYQCNSFFISEKYGAFTGFAGTSIGIHSRGSGATNFNAYYGINSDSTFYYKSLDEQMKIVEDLIVDEEALEFAFEGYRYYDLLRVALRRENEEPTYLSDKILNRRSGQDTGIETNLMDKKNWFLHWKGQIGY